MRRSTAIALVVAILTLGAARAAAQELTVAAASDLQAALPTLAARFEQQTGRRVRLTFGSSGNFFAQIQNGAPFDLFLSADIDYPRRLEADGRVERGTVARYATGRLVLWTRKDSGIDIRRGLAALEAPNVRRIAIANPQHAPYGRAAIAALQSAGVHDKVRERLVLGENISQAAQFAESGNADAGIIALSLAVTPALTAAGTYVHVPASLHPPVEQGAAVVAASRNKDVAKRFLAFLRSEASVRYLQEAGLAP